VAAASLVCLLATSCGTAGVAERDPEAPPLIVATNTIWADVAANVACDGLAEVVSLLPPGADPHAFELSMADRARLDQASMIVTNGLGLEGGMEDPIESAESGGVPVFRAGDHVEVIASDEDGGGHEEHGSDEPVDPHIWQDPTRTAAVAVALGDALVEDAGLDRDAVRRCVEDYGAELSALDDEVAQTTAAIPAESRVLVTNHDSLRYFADRYDFEILGTVIPAPGAVAEANPADIEALAEAIESTGVAAVFAEQQHSDSDVQALADRVGDVEVVHLHTDSLGEDEASSYIGMVRSNAHRIADALTTEPS
jgi:zinc/manganese transport system substrate-binding protein